jgi:hypothetical protein
LAPSFSPKNYPGLITWYNASSAILNDASFIIGLRDKSGNNNTVISSNIAVARNPADPLGIPYFINLHINTKPLEFTSELTGLTVFLVANNNTNTDPSDIDIEEYQNYLTIFQNQSNKPIQIGINKTINANNNTNFNTIIIYSGEYGSINLLINPNTCNIINAICFNSNINIRNNDVSSAAIYQNGSVMYYIRSESILRINTNINTFNITIGDDGTDDERTHKPLNSSIYEIIIYNSVLSESDISDINKYLGDKYNIPLTNEGNFTYRQDL